MLARGTFPLTAPTAPTAPTALTALTALAAVVTLAGCAPAQVPSSGVAELQATDPPRLEWGLVIHGGAGGRTVPDWTAEERTLRERGMEAALRAGHAVLAAGGSSLDAVQAAVVILEDDSLFNAGRGAVFTSDGRQELDAALMDGATLRVGAVAGLHRVKNPIALARAVMEQSEHVMMIGEGAERFAESVGIRLVDPSYFFTQSRWRSLDSTRRAEQQRRDSTAADGSRFRGSTTSAADAGRLGTAGAVALDRQGRLAVATSTGGITSKRYGRVGDVPIIGAGTYANAECAVSATGKGEYFIRYTVARDICASVQYRGLTIAAAADEIIQGTFERLKVDGGVIALDRRGNMAMPFNTALMPRGYIAPDGQPRVWLTR